MNRRRWARARGRIGAADFVHALPDSRVEPGDRLVVSGPTQAVEAFAALT